MQMIKTYLQHSHRNMERMALKKSNKAIENAVDRFQKISDKKSKKVFVKSIFFV